jgi:hypothetical protein
MTSKMVFYNVYPGFTYQDHVVDGVEICSREQLPEAFVERTTEYQMAKYGKVYYSRYEPTEEELERMGYSQKGKKKELSEEEQKRKETEKAALEEELEEEIDEIEALEGEKGVTVREKVSKEEGKAILKKKSESQKRRERKRKEQEESGESEVRDGEKAQKELKLEEMTKRDLVRLALAHNVSLSPGSTQKEMVKILKKALQGESNA